MSHPLPPPLTRKPSQQFTAASTTGPSGSQQVLAASGSQQVPAATGTQMSSATVQSDPNSLQGASTTVTYSNQVKILFC